VSVRGERHQAHTSRASSFGCILFTVEQTELGLLAADCYRRLPLLFAPRPVNTSIGRCRPSITAQVLAVLVGTSDPEVQTSVIESVVIDVVALPSVRNHRQSEQLAVQHDLDSVAVDYLCSGRVTGVSQPPRPLPCPLGIYGVNQRVRLQCAVLSMQRDTGGQSISVKEDRPRRRAGDTANGSTLCSARSTAIPAAASSDLVWRFKEVVATPLADARNGTLSWHRASSGAAPRTVVSGFGARLRCQNYTRSLQVGAA
jgi:hypothetical protein